MSNEAQVDPRDGRLVGVRHAFPAVVARAIDERVLVGDAERIRMRAVLGLHIAELDVAVQPPPHRDEAAAGLDHTVRFVNEHAHARECAREDELLQRLEEVVVIVDLRLEVVGENGEPAICEANDLDDGGAYLSIEDSTCRTPRVLT